MDSGVLVYGDVTFDTVGCVHSECLKSNTVNLYSSNFSKEFLLFQPRSGPHQLDVRGGGWGGDGRVRAVAEDADRRLGRGALPRHHRREPHGDDQLQDGQAAADHLQLLPLLPRRRGLHHR